MEVGEKPRVLRRVEKEFREILKPEGVIGSLLFERFWTSYLRLILVGRLESDAVSKAVKKSEVPEALPVVREGPVPVLLVPQGSGESGVRLGLPAILSVNALQHLAVVARYDAHFGRELYRALLMLLAMREGGLDALLDAFKATPRVEELGRGRK